MQSSAITHSCLSVETEKSEGEIEIENFSAGLKDLQLHETKITQEISKEIGVEAEASIKILLFSNPSRHNFCF